MKLYLKDHFDLLTPAEDKEAQELVYDLPIMAVLSSAPKIPGAVIKQANHIKFKNLRSRHVVRVRLPI
jgi:hypothetical protein